MEEGVSPGLTKHVSVRLSTLQLSEAGRSTVRDGAVLQMPPESWSVALKVIICKKRQAVELWETHWNSHLPLGCSEKVMSSI